jgi:biotin carboxylase
MRVLVLGASRYYTRSILRLQAEGHVVAAIDRDAGAPGLDVADYSAVCDIVDVAGTERVAIEFGPDVILPLNDFGVPTAAKVSERLGLPSISVTAAMAATNKERMRDIWSASGLPCPRYIVEEDRELLRSAILTMDLPVIIKPAHGIGGGSRGVVVIHHESEIDEAITISQAHYDDKATIVEQFLPGDSEHSAEFVLVSGEPVLVAIGDKEKSPLPFRVDKSVIYPTALTATEVDGFMKIALGAITSLGIDRGTVHLEFSRTKDSFVLFELGARCGGGSTPEPIVRFLTGIDLINEQVKSIAGIRSEIHRNQLERACVYRFLTPAPGRVNGIHGWTEIVGNPAVLDAHLDLSIGDTIQSVTSGPDRTGFIVVAGETRGAALSAANTLESRLTIVYEN